MLIQVALNGGRTRADHPAIPFTPVELAASAKESVAAGATSIHFHVRARDGRESAAPDDVAAALEAIRSATPGTPVGVSTGAWIVPDPQLRHETISRWMVLPDFASVNFKEQGAAALAKMLIARGVGVEGGVSDVRGAELLVASGLASNCLRMLIEPFEEETRDALQTLGHIEAVLDRVGMKAPRLLHGMNKAAWDLIDAAAGRRYDTRVGFEDTLTLPDGKRAASNAVLVSEAVRRMRDSPAL
jgi:uncharacterized protein (DUF849 family)